MNGFSANIRKRAPGQAELDPAVYPSLVDADFEEVYMHHFTVNKWQIGGQKEFEDLVEKGEPFHGTAVDLITKEAGISEPFASSLPRTHAPSPTECAR